MAMEGTKKTDFVRRKTDRGEELNLPPMDIYCSHYVSKVLSFTVKRKLKRLDLATSVISSPTHHDSAQRLAALKQLASLIVEDTRLGDYLDSKVLPELISFLEFKERKTPIQGDNHVRKKPHPEDLKNRRFQYYSAIVLTNIVSSKKGIEFKDHAIPALVKLITTWHWFVQIQVLCALSNIANVFPDTCYAIIKNGALEHLESLLTNAKNHYVLRKSGCELLPALCRMEPHVPFDKIRIVLCTLKTAIFYESVSILVPTCLALSNFTNKKFVEIGSEVYERLLHLIEYTVPEIVLYALRAIGNYVRWCDNDQLKSVINGGLPLHLVGLLYHKHTEVRKETCWIISNITAVADKSHLQVVINCQLILLLVEFFEKAEVEVMEVAACAISNAVLGSDKKQFEYLTEKCFEPLNIIRYFADEDDSRTITACLQVRDVILYHAKILEVASLPSLPEEMERLGIGAHMTSDTSDYLPSAEYA